MRMSIRTKMLVNFVPLAVTFVVLFYTAYTYLNTMRQDSAHAILLIKESAAMSRLHASTSVLYEGVHDYLLSSDGENRARFAKATAVLKADLRAVNKLEILSTELKEIKHERKILDKVTASTAQAIETGDKVMRLRLPEESDRGYALMRQGDWHVEEATLALRAFEKIDEYELRGSLARLRAVQGTVMMVLGAFGFIGALSLVSIVGIERSFTGPIYRFAQGVKHISEGNLDYRLKIQTGDEIEDLAEAFNEMVFNMYQEEQTAAEIQRRLLPRSIIRLPGLKLHAKEIQAKLVGGDWYDYYRIGSTLYLLIADASGKGMPGALVATVAMSAIRSEPKTETNMESLLTRVNKTVEARLGGTDFVTLFMAMLDLDTNELTFVNCGHEPPLFYPASRENWTLLPCDSGMPLGITGGDFHPHTQKILLNAGDKFILYTDGLHDVRDKDGRFFNMELVRHWLDRHRQLPIEPLMDGVVEEALAFGDGRLVDDVTLLGFQLLNHRGAASGAAASSTSVRKRPV